MASEALNSTNVVKHAQYQANCLETIFQYAPCLEDLINTIASFLGLKDQLDSYFADHRKLESERISKLDVKSDDTTATPVTTTAAKVDDIANPAAQSTSTEETAPAPAPAPASAPEVIDLDVEYVPHVEKDLVVSFAGVGYTVYADKPDVTSLEYTSPIDGVLNAADAREFAKTLHADVEDDTYYLMAQQSSKLEGPALTVVYEVTVKLVKEGEEQAPYSNKNGKLEVCFTEDGETYHYTLACIGQAAL